MKGYIYTLYKNADPANGWHSTDPIFGNPPTLGACVPNIRRLVEPGDMVFVVSGRTHKLSQYVVGGLTVAEKITAMEAYRRYPQYRQCINPEGGVSGNIIVDEFGNHNDIDVHTNFERRLENYIVGRDAIVLEASAAVDRARRETLGVLSSTFQRPGNRVFDVIGRWRRLDEDQVEHLSDWLKDVRDNS